MPYQEVNGAQIYYEIFGDDASIDLPLLLIHGSTIDGQTDWGKIAPLLGMKHRVIVPDCRGHGKSTNPTLSYSFKEMAADAVGLLQALGYSRAHLVGHSNGGNVALVALMEYPEVFQCVVLQAANAFVSPDLVEIEPAKFDPQRVERENPGWMESMIALHGQTYGRTYWRRMLELTLQEIISQPNYSAQELGKVQRPVLVIQGGKDTVNAASEHGQFMAAHIPFAEFWSPKGIGHNVHQEIPLAWIERVLSFIKRRGDPANEALYRLGQEHYADERESIFEVRANHNQEPEGIDLTGRVLFSQQRQAAIEAVAGASDIPQAAQIDPEQVEILLDEKSSWALVNRPVSDLRREPGNLAERVSQALLGESLRVLSTQGDWSLVRLEHDGYMGWLQTAAIWTCSQNDVQNYQVSCTSLVVDDFLAAVTEPGAADANPEGESAPVVGRLFFGLRVPVITGQTSQVQVRLPDGRLWWVQRSGQLPLEQAPQANQAGIAAALERIQRFVGVPYLWGGRSPYGYDCSGLAQTFMAVLGLQIPRDADQQCHAGKPIEGKPQPGDLLFFADRKAARASARHQAITHVAISLGEELVVHATGATWCTTLNSLNPDHPLYRPWLRENLVDVRRYV